MEHLPPWLRDLPLPPRPVPSAGAEPTWLHAADEPAPPPPPAAAAGADDVPDWLRDLQSEVAGAEPAAEESPRSAPPAGSGEETPDWLRDLEGEASTPDQSDPSRAAPFGATSWLAGLGHGQEPPAEEPPAEEPPTTTTSRIRMPVGATDWLRSIGQEPDVDEELARAEEERAAPPPEEDKSGVPDWLRDITPEDLESEVEIEPAPDSQPIFDPEAPGWLVEERSPDASTVSADADVPLDDTVASSDDVPEWLREIVPAEELPGAGPREPSSPPDWLGEGDEESGADVPDWLRRVSGDDQPSGDEAPAWLAEEPAAAAGDEAPSWLQEAEEPSAASDDVPSWLRGAEEPPAASREPAASDDVPSWLREAEEPPAASREPAASDEVPAWLREAEEPPAASREPAASDDVPAWLREAEEPPAASREPAASDDVPAWLREAEEPPAASREPAASDDVPAWLREAEEPPAASREPAASDDVPAWLREAEEPPVVGREPAASDDVPAADDEVPSWLREMEPGSAGAPPAGPPAASDEVPAWLREAEESPPPPPPMDVPAWLAEPAADAGPPPTWLREALDEEGPAPEGPPASGAAAGDLPPWLASDEPPAGQASSAPGDMSLPSWLRGVADEPVASGPTPESPRPVRGSEEPPRRGATPHRGATPDSEGDDFLRGADLPSWLRPTEPERPADTTESQTFDWLTRLGVGEREEETETSVTAVAAAAIPRRPGYQRSAEQLAAMTLLSQLVRSPYPETAPAPAAPAVSRWQRIGIDRMLYALLALTLIAGLLLPQLGAPFQTATPSAPGAAELSAAIDALDSDDVVLVAYEWGAQRSAELRPMEQAVMRRLIAGRVKLIMVSTDLQGALLSFDQREPLRAAGYNNENGLEFGGRDYVLLGYRPGGELALRSLARDLRGELRSDFNGQDATQGLLASTIESIRDVSMILVMADQPQDVQAWMEQVHPAARSVPIAFLLPYEVQPIVQPYLSGDGVYHMAGLQGALAFDAGAPNVNQELIARSAGQQALAIVVFVLLLLLGAIGAAITRARRPRGGAA